MNDFNSILVIDNFDLGKIIHLVEKSFFIIGILLYLVFAIVVVRQISIMKKTIITDLLPTITLLGLAHLILTVVVLVGFLLFL